MTVSSARPSSDSDVSPALAAGDVHVWLYCSPTEGGSGLFEACRQVISDEEWQRCQRIVDDQRDMAVITRGLVRLVLSRYAAEAPADWQFQSGRHGKPFLCEPSVPLCFNLSHSGDWFALAVTLGSEIGVDIQRCEPQRNIERLASRYFCPEELVDLEQLEGAARAARFYDLWSLKEAWSKAHGAALPTSLSEICFSLGLSSQIQVSAPAGKASGQLWLLDPAPGYRLALCCLAEAETVLRPQFHELSDELPGRPLELPCRARGGGVSGQP